MLLWLVILKIIQVVTMSADFYIKKDQMAVLCYK